MSKTLLVGATALMIGAASFAAAQPYPGGMMGDGGMMGGRMGGHGQGGQQQYSPDDARAFVDARIAALHAGLKLTAEQEKNWPPFEQAYRELAQQRVQWRTEQRNQAQPDSPIDRLQRRADRLSVEGAALKKLANASAPLYQSLDDGQKRRFAVLARPGGARQHSAFRHGGGRGPGWSDQGGRPADGGTGPR
jgi:zinc resistance-associated protein